MFTNALVVHIYVILLNIFYSNRKDTVFIVKAKWNLLTNFKHFFNFNKFQSFQWQIFNQNSVAVNRLANVNLLTAIMR